MALSHITVAPSFIPESTHPCHRNSPAYAGLPHANEHLREHVILTPTLLSPRPGWNCRWCYHRSVPKPLCDNHHSVGNIITVQSGINPRVTLASLKVLFRDVKVSFRSFSCSGSRHFALPGAAFGLYTGQFSRFPAWRYCKSRIYAGLHSGFSSNF